MRNIKFSILIPTKDRLELLCYAVNSVLNQTYENWELIVSDNCSKDDIGTWIRSVNDRRIIYHRQSSPVSVTDNWNSANDMATGDYIIMLGDDDALTPNALTILKDHIVTQNYPDVLCFPAYIYYQPGVVPLNSDGDVQKTIPVPVENSAKVTELSREWRKNLAEQCVQFEKGAIYYNMQFYCYSKENVARLKKYGNYYEPPFPDYYTTCMSFMLSERFVYIPEYITVIGVTPKSYGGYIQNNKDKEGMAFHNESDYRCYAIEPIKKYVCSIDEMDTGAFVTFALVAGKLDLEYPNVFNYYKAVIRRTIDSISDLMYIYKTEMCPHLNDNEKDQLLKYIYSNYENSFIKNKSMVSGLSYKTINDLIKDIPNIESSTRFGDLSTWETIVDWDNLKKKINNRKVLLWGAYNRSIGLKNILDDKGIEIFGFIDKYFGFDSYHDLPVFRPTEALNPEKEYYVFIPLVNVYSEILEMLDSYGYVKTDDYECTNSSNKTTILPNYADINSNTISCNSKNETSHIIFCGTGSSVEFKGDFQQLNNVTLVAKGDKLNIVIEADAIIPDNSIIVFETDTVISGDLAINHQTKAIDGLDSIFILN